MSSEEEESFDEQVARRSKGLSKATVQRFVEFQSLFSPKLIFERYKRNSRTQKSVFVVVLLALLLSACCTLLAVMDLTRSLPPVLLMVDYLRQLTSIRFVNLACFASLDQSALGFPSMFNRTTSQSFSTSCPERMVGMRIGLGSVRSSD